MPKIPRLILGAGALVVALVIFCGLLMLYAGPMPETTVDTSRYTPAQLREVERCENETIHDWVRGGEAKDYVPSLDECVREAAKIKG